MDDMRAAVQNSPAALPDCAKAYSNDPERANCNGNNGLFLMTVEKIANIKLKGDKEIQNVPVYGAFCTGAYSYVWNSGYLFSDDVIDKGGANVATLVYDGESVGDFRLVKVRDNKREVCAGSGVYNSSDSNAGITGEFTVGRTGEEPKVLLSASTGNALALYDLNVAIPALNDLGNAAFYSISFILGTVQGGINVMSSGNFCETPGSDSGLGNFDYCAINKFNFAAQANGG